MAGPAAGILQAERIALNFMQRMSGIASLTNRYVRAVEGTRSRIVDTRKTAPGHRYLDKYAVRAGGGYNHRYNLADGILIKDNHIEANRFREMGLRQVIELACNGRLTPSASRLKSSLWTPPARRWTLALTSSCWTICRWT